YYFCFSRRRRHTRSKRDWSSDVCSSDLEIIQIRRHLHKYPELSFQEKETSQYIIDFYKDKNVSIDTNVGNGYGIVVTIKGKQPRSEERRVGKESRTRWIGTEEKETKMRE